MDVIFETSTGRSFSMEIGFFDTVLEVKEKIQKYHGISVAKQTLVFRGRVLQDNSDVQYCEILHNSRIQLLTASEVVEKSAIDVEEEPKKIHIFLMIPRSILTPIPLEIDLNDTVFMLKEKICEMEHVAGIRLRLYYKGRELQDYRSLRDCELIDNSDIDVIVQPFQDFVVDAATDAPPSRYTTACKTTTPNIRTNVTTHDGTFSFANNLSNKKLTILVVSQCGMKRIPMEVKASDNVGELKKRLQRLQDGFEFQLSPEEYFFIYRQTIMNDDKSFRWHQVGNGDTIEIFNGSVST